MKKQFFVVLFLAFTMLYFYGCEKKTTPTETTGPKENEFIITGKVTRADTKEPVYDAIVSFYVENPVATRTDTAGYYGFKITTTVVYTAKLIASKEGVGTSDTLEVTVFPQRQISQDITIKTTTVPVRKSGPAASIVLISTSVDNISVKGTGANESSQLIFEVRDSSGIAVDPDHKVTVTFAIQGGPNGGEFVSPSSLVTDSSGQVKVTLGSGTKPGVLQLVAQAIVGARQIQSSPVSVSIVGGLPEATHFTLSSNISTNLVWLATGDPIGQINVQVGDKFGNPARPGTPVYFSASAGVIEGTAKTDDKGKVSVTWSGGNPPPSSDGRAYVTASTIGEKGVIISDTLRFEFGKVVLPHRPGAASISLVSISRQQLSVRGAGTNESADIIFEVRDSSGVPIGLSNRVTVIFSLQGGLNGGEYLTPVSVETDTVGRVKTTLNSGTKAGVIQISALVQVGTAVVRSSQVTVTISGGAPDRYHFSMTSNVISNIDWPQAGTVVGTIKVQIGDIYSNPVQQNTSVYFSATAGVIQGTGYTDETGIVNVNWYSGNPPPQNNGSAFVKASVVGENGVAITDSLMFVFTGSARKSGPATSIVLISTSVDNISVKGTGANESSQLIFEVRDSSGVPVNMENKTTVTFSIQGGPNGGEFVSPHSKDTDSSGQVKVTLGAGTKPGVLQVIAEAIVGTRQIKSSPVSVSIVGGLPDAAHFTLSSDIPVNVVWPQAGTVIGTINVQVGDKFGNPVRPGTPVYFSASAGVIEGTAKTDDKGKVSVTWSGGNPPPSEDGQAYITANTIGENGVQISDILHFEFGKIVLPHRPGAASISLISISRQQLSVRGAGTNESADIIFEIRDSTGVPVGLSNKVTVDFSIQGGVNGGEFLTPVSAETDTAGKVKTTINAGTKAGVIQISAQVQVGTAIIRSSQVTVTISGGAPNPYHFSITSNVVSNIDWPKPGTIIGTIKVQVGDKYGNPVQLNTSVYFSTTAGIIEGTGYTDGNGIVSVDWRSGNPPPPRNGFATVTASVVGENGVPIADSLRFTFTGPAITGGEARVIQFISASNTLLSVDEAAGPQSSEITFEVRDSLGNPVNQNHQAHVKFSFSYAPQGAYLSPQEVDTDPQTGRVKTNVVAGLKAGPIQILAELTTITGSYVRSLPVQLQISGGLPDYDHFSIGFLRLNTQAYDIINVRTGVVAVVGDRYSNPVRPATAVYFRTTAGIIPNNTAFTDKDGIAQTELISGNPDPFFDTTIVGIGYLGAGYHKVFAATVDADGNQIQVWGLHLFTTDFPRITNMNPTTIAVPAGGSQTFEFDVTDGNGNVCTGGTTLGTEIGFETPQNTTFKVKVGDNFPDGGLPDALGRGWGLTHFQISVEDGTPGGTHMLWAGYVKIKIATPRGSIGYYLTGTVGTP
ncbi:MAG: hypothetical protein ABSB78_09335 [Bacteroidota bacterium]